MRNSVEKKFLIHKPIYHNSIKILIVNLLCFLSPCLVQWIANNIHTFLLLFHFFFLLILNNTQIAIIISTFFFLLVLNHEHWWLFLCLFCSVYVYFFIQKKQTVSKICSFFEQQLYVCIWDNWLRWEIFKFFSSYNNKKRYIPSNTCSTIIFLLRSTRIL